MADPADVLARVLATPAGEAIVDSAEDRARLIELVREAAPALTVGEALSLPQVQRGEAVVEYRERYAAEQGTFEFGTWHQARLAMRDGMAAVETRRWSTYLKAPRWFRWTDNFLAGDALLSCTIVPLAQADADPSTRGAM